MVSAGGSPKVLSLLQMRPQPPHMWSSRPCARHADDLPESNAEVQAEKDLQRAEFAMSTPRLENQRALSPALTGGIEPAPMRHQKGRFSPGPAVSRWHSAPEGDLHLIPLRSLHLPLDRCLRCFQ